MISKKVILLSLVVLLWPTVFAGAGPTVSREDGSFSEQAANYVPGQMIVKFKDSLTQSAYWLMSSQQSFQNATGDSSLDQLLAEYRVTEVIPIFRDPLQEKELIKDGKVSVADLKQEALEKFERVKRKFPERAKRAPQNASIPADYHVYRLTLGRNVSVLKAVAAFSQNPHVAYAHPVYIMTIQ